MASIAEKVQKAAEKVVLNAKQSQLADFTNDLTKDQGIRTYFGVLQSDTDTVLKAGVRGPTLVEDIHAREKISHFDHERIPERVIHARGTGAHGVFKLHTAVPDVTFAELFNEVGVSVPAFVRFSTAQGFRGSSDTVRDVRGFATRFYTKQGNFDIVGNNNPVFFIQEAIKFPDLVHALKPEPHNEIPQAQSAHDNFWDFISYIPESMHHVMWQMSDRNIPRSYRMMQGFGVHSFLMTNTSGEQSFVKFHWTPKLGTHGLVWDEALKLSGQDPDFHRRDLYEAIEAGAYPKWDLGLQVVPASKEHDFDFDLLDSSKIIPEELVPIRYIGTLTLNSNVTEFFPETEQVAFCTQHMIPGIDHSNDPLLHLRSFSYFDTQLIRLGGPNFGSIPINRPIGCPMFSNTQRDGYHRDVITKSRVNYWPNRFNTPHPVPPEKGGYVHQPTPIHNGAKERVRGPKFNDHYSQATLFWNSMSAVEQEHIIEAFQFELGRCDDKGVQERMVEHLNRVDNGLAVRVAVALSIPPPKEAVANHGKRSEYLSMLGEHNTFTAVGRKVGIYVYDDFDFSTVEALRLAFAAAGIIAMVVGPRKGVVTSSSNLTLYTHFSFETCRSTFFDAVFFAGGGGKGAGQEAEYLKQLSRNGRVVHAAREAFMHYKTVGASGVAVDFLSKYALPIQLEGLALQAKEGSNVVVDQGVVLAGTSGLLNSADLTMKFMGELSKHRAWGRDISGVAA